MVSALPMAAHLCHISPGPLLHLSHMFPQLQDHLPGPLPTQRAPICTSPAPVSFFGSLYPLTHFSAVQIKWLYALRSDRNHIPVSIINIFLGLYASPSCYKVMLQLHTFLPPLTAVSHKASRTQVIPLNSMG